MSQKCTLPPNKSTQTEVQVTEKTADKPKDSCAKDQGQPANCPLEYINVTKSKDEIKVVAKGRTSSTPEDPRLFTGPERYQDYDTFWSFMKTNLKDFDQCKDPLDNDPDRFKSKSQPAPTQLSNKPLKDEHVMTIDEIMNEDDEMAYIEKDLDDDQSNFDHIISLILRSLTLFALIYLMVSYVPTTYLEITTKILIAGTVVIVYALLDWIGRLLKYVKDYACQRSCKGCR
jgi:hypothetical protein